MSHLHTVNDPALLGLCLRSIERGDSLLFIEDGVYCAQRKHSELVPDDVSIYVMQSDVEARGLINRIEDKAIPASDSDFVRLCCENSKIINWF